MTLRFFKLKKFYKKNVEVGKKTIPQFKPQDFGKMFLNLFLVNQLAILRQVHTD